MSRVQAPLPVDFVSVIPIIYDKSKETKLR